MKKKRITKGGKLAVEEIADDIRRGVYGDTPEVIIPRIKNALIERCNYAASGHIIAPHSALDMLMIEWRRGVFSDLNDTVDAIVKAV